MNRVPVFLIVFLAVAVLALATFALSPTLMGGAAIDYNNFVIFIELAVIGTVLGFGWLAFGYAQPTKVWLIPLGVVAAWCLVVGGMTLLTNVIAKSHEETSLREAEERADALRAPNQVDSKGQSFPDDYIRRQLGDIEDEIKRTRERLNYKAMGVYLSLGMLLVGVASAGKFALLFRQRNRAS
jgi:hypothetical protein